MDSYYVNLDNAKRLAEQGYKGEFPQMVWCRHYITNKPYLTFWTTSVMNKVGIPAPTHLAALDWLRIEKKQYWGHDFDDIEGMLWTLALDYEQYMLAPYDPSGETDINTLQFQTPDELISAILDHLEGVSHD